jgi:hypothetical protein
LWNMVTVRQGGSVEPTTARTIWSRPLPTLLSQLLVAFTIEFDNEFERRMGESGYPGARLSLVVWSNLMRFVAGDGATVRDLAAQALTPEQGVKFELGCLERWGFVVLQPDPADDRPIPFAEHRQARRILRDGWGSGRGIRGGWIVLLTSKGLKAAEIWPPLFGEIEARWETRLGSDEVNRLRKSLQAVVSRLDLELPYGFPPYWPVAATFPPRVTPATEQLPLPTLLSQLLLAFTIEFDRESQAPLALCANALRVLGEKPIHAGEIPRLTGGSSETSGIGWQLKPYVVVEPSPAGSRGKAVSLTPLGLRVQQTYFRLIDKIGKRWEEQFGKDEIRRLRDLLQALFDGRDANGPLLSAGLVPPAGVVRAGVQAAALGRRDVGAAARQRMRDLVTQTQEFVRDPANTLPHYPLWDMNRGFGP